MAEMTSTSTAGRRRLSTSTRVLSLLNDRWRTDVTAVADAGGTVELTATQFEAGVPSRRPRR